MKKLVFSKAVAQSRKIRESYHQLEVQHHGSKWTTEEDALAFLTDAGLVGRMTMAREGRGPTENETDHQLEHKLGECIWWLIVLAERMGIDAESALGTFLTKTEQQLRPSFPAARPRAKVKVRARKRAK